MSGRLFGYARVSMASDADANNLHTHRWVPADCEQVFEDVGSGASVSTGLAYCDAGGCTISVGLLACNLWPDTFCLQLTLASYPIGNAAQIPVQKLRLCRSWIEK